LKFLRTRSANVEEEAKYRSETNQQLQDEILALTIQLNLSEQQNERLRAENQSLEERWLKKIETEADAVNTANAIIERYVVTIVLEKGFRTNNRYKNLNVDVGDH
jgi:hypothetical protein